MTKKAEFETDVVEVPVEKLKKLKRGSKSVALNVLDVAVVCSVEASEEAIRLRAYQKWEAAGRPLSDGTEFWYQAELELNS